jgi:cell division protein FtsW (lipid II flippase)
MGLGFLMVMGSAQARGEPVTAADLIPLGIYGLSLSLVHLTLVLGRFRGDQVLLSAVAFLSGFGLLTQFRLGTFATSDSSVLDYLVFPAGILLMAAFSLGFMRGRYRRLASWGWLWALLSLALLGGLLLTGERFRGGVYASGFVTPAEILKVTVVLFLAGFIDQHAKALSRWGSPPILPPLGGLAPLMGFWALLAGLLLLQRDLGMLIILSLALLALLYLGTRRVGYLVYAGLGAALLGYLLLRVFSHGQRRIQAWQDPFQDPTGSSWQILQGLSGMYSGGLWGEGFGEGKPEYTPIAESDFIYSVIGEELGFFGCTMVVVFFLIFFARGWRIASQSRSPYGRLLSAGLTMIVATQTFLNIGGVTKFIPLTGITLPFISHGGSSLLTAFVSLGLILAVSDGEPPGTRRRTRAKPPSGSSRRSRKPHRDHPPPRRKGPTRR